MPKERATGLRTRVSERRARLVVIVLALLASAAAAAIASEGGAPERAGRLATAAIAAPRAASPADAAVVDAVPAFTWRSVRGADHYEFQFSADARFRSTLASYETKNTAATIDETLFDDTYHWRVRAVNVAGTAGRWSAVRSIRKRWPTKPRLSAPADGAQVAYPSEPLVLHWEPTPYAAKYEVTLSTDPGLAGNLLLDAGRPLQVGGTSVAVPFALTDGTTYHWAVTPIDAGDLKGPRSETRSFTWRWPSKPTTRIADLWNDADGATFVDPQFSWDPVPGAARYEVEVSPSASFAPGSKVCCADLTTGTSLSPTKLLANNTDVPGAEEGYHWRVRALDLNGNAGAWSDVKLFRKAFDEVVPTVPALRVRNHLWADVTGGTTDAPILDWEPVAGASSYEVRVVPRSLGACNWNASANISWGTPQPVEVTGTAWTPLAPVGSGTPVPFGGIASENDKLAPGEYCARVRARTGVDTSGKRVVSDWTTLGGIAGPAFSFSPASVAGPSVALVAGDYLSPLAYPVQPVQRSMPLFRWKHVQGACNYYVVVARDQNFTTIVDVARTKIPAYAPRLRTYADETTSYYWAVLPVWGTPCDVVSTTPQDNAPRTFNKSSHPPIRKSPGAVVLDQPTFSWKGLSENGLSEIPAPIGARQYRLQVATDASFSNLIDDVTTSSTAYTSSSTYPADAQVWWRVRASDERDVGLNWSAAGSFRRLLRRPVPSPTNPTRGDFFPVFLWSPVQGAVSYGFHLEEPDGDQSDYVFNSTAAAFRKLQGLGTFRWQVRANFPKKGNGTVPGGYSAPQSFTRFIDPPTGARLDPTAGRVLLNWEPNASAHRYRVEFSETNSFTRVLDTGITKNTNYAPRLRQPGFTDGGRLFWRVAAVDEGNNLGAWATGTVSLPRGLRVVVSGRLVPRRRSRVTVTVLNGKGRPVTKARVKVKGAGVRSRPRRTGKRGSAIFALRPTKRGTVTFTVRKRGYRSGRASTPVR